MPEPAGGNPQRACLDRLMLMWDQLRPLAYDPVPLLAKNGTVVIHPETGKVVPDASLQVSAMKLMMDVMDRVQRIVDIRVVATTPLEELQEVIKRIRDEVREAEEQADAEREGDKEEDDPPES